MFKYKTIAKVLLLGFSEERIVGHLLLTNSNEFQVDLTSDCLFNYLPVLSVLNETRVETLEDIFKYCKERKIKISKDRILKNGLLVGGEKDFLITKGLKGNWQNNNGLLDRIVDYIIETVQTESITSGFQYMVSVTQIEEKFEVKLNLDYINCINNLLLYREEVGATEIDGNYINKDLYFDVVLYTDYAPNYNEELFVW